MHACFADTEHKYWHISAEHKKVNLKFFPIINEAWREFKQCLRSLCNMPTCVHFHHHEEHNLCRVYVFQGRFDIKKMNVLYFSSMDMQIQYNYHNYATICKIPDFFCTFMVFLIWCTCVTMHGLSFINHI